MESEFVRWLRTWVSPSPWVRVGPGDDAAVLRLGEAAETIVTSDLLADGVHFRTGRDDASRIGRKALAVNLSDLAAMAARPIAGFFSVALPRDGGHELAIQLYEGIRTLAEQYNVAVAGGDTNTWNGQLVISVTLLGQPGPGGPLLRSGAVPGDQLLVTGDFGGSSLGHHFDFQPRVQEALTLAEHYKLHAGIDCSDGLSLDAARLGAESGCGVVIDLAAVPVAAAADRLAATGATKETALDHALADGEDFELILAVPPDDARAILDARPLDVAITRIGEFIGEPGLWYLRDGRREPASPRGYEH